MISATHDTKKGIYDLACNKFDTQIAIVENLNDYDSIQESCVRLYDVGRKRDKEDELEEDDDEEEDDDDLDNSDDDGSNSGSNSLSLSGNLINFVDLKKSKSRFVKFLILE